MQTRLLQNLTAALALLIVAAVCFQTLLVHPTDVLVGTQNRGHNDTTNYFIASKSFQEQSFQQFHEFPYWNPYSLLGMPELGNPQSSMFYPVNWVFFFFSAATTISWVMVLHHWLAGCGAYLLARKYQLSFFSALLSGIIFLAAPYFAAKTGEGHFTAVTQIAWFPWILYGYELLREGSRKAVPLLVIAISLAFFCGHVQELYFLLLFLSASLVVEAVLAWVGRKSLNESETVETSPPVSGGKLLKDWGMAGLLTLGLVAIDLIPIFIFTRQAVRTGGIDLTALNDGSLSLTSLLQLLDPFVWGGPEKYAGPGFYYWEAVCSFGCLPLFLAILGVVSAYSQRTVIRLTLIGLAAFLLSFGPNLPFYAVVHQIIPGISMFRIPGRLIWICSLAVALLAGFGSEWVYQIFQTTNRKTYRLIAGICFVTGLVTLGGLLIASQGYLPLPRSSGPEFRIQLSYCLLGILGLSLAIFLGSLSRKAALGGMLTLCLCCTAELAWYNFQIYQTIPQSGIRDETPISVYLNEHLQGQRVLVNQVLLSDREAWQNRIYKIQGYEPVPLVRLGLLAAATFPEKHNAIVMAGYNSPDLKQANGPLLDLMNVKYAVLPTREPVELEGWRTVLQGTVPQEFTPRGSKPRQIPFVILENENPLPRAFVVGQTRALNPDQDSRKIVSTLEKLKPRQELLLQQDLLPSGKREPFQAARIHDEKPNSLRIEAHLNAPGYLVISDIYYPGWTAHLGEQELPVLPADYALRAIPLPAGQHEVQLSYVPPGYQLGRVISLTALAVLFVLLVTAFRSPAKPAGD
ncbi:Bacterial membrane protein YfhO [Gimesia panareensis]|uniref:Bacterial membrane protein YfhO n=1 Tax=Gimesia panareensis TaxID=2527978 RepID=A0A517Q620_9PLAN|nr:YfhO family protein [Gimesia panareensis]QDT27089.1 Bacterial membrane protein YfhO [Gimesia panareensis]